MPFDPSLPVEHTLADAAQMRAQFQGIVDLIDTIPVGPPGPQGEPGPAGTSVSGAVVDGVTSLNPGDPATASAFFDGSDVHFSFGIPRGNDGSEGPAGSEGEPGEPGTPGAPGPQGDPGPAGPPFGNFTVDSVSTLPAGQGAWVQTTFDGFVHFSFGIPQGFDGPSGPTGQNGADGQPGAEGPPFTNFTVDGVSTLDPGLPATVQTSYDGTFVRFAFGIPRGNDGPQGPQGTPGEVTLQQLQEDIGGTSSNTNGVATLGLPVSDPPTQSEVQQIVDKLNELITGLRRFGP